MTAIGSASSGTPNWVTKPMKKPAAAPAAAIVNLFRTPASSASESAKPAQAIAAASSANNESPLMSGPPHELGRARWSHLLATECKCPRR